MYWTAERPVSVVRRGQAMFPPFKHVHHMYIDEKHIPYDTRQVEGLG
jgi:hypothetical protein